VVNTKRFLGISGMVFAVLGGISWFFHNNIVAILCWSVAGLILFKLNKRKNKNKKR